MVYQIIGTATHVWINYTNSTHGTASLQDATLPWTYSWNTAAVGDFVSVSAFIGGDDKGNAPPDGSLTVTVTRDGSVVKTMTSQGGLFTTASASILLQ